MLQGLEASKYMCVKYVQMISELYDVTKCTTDLDPFDCLFVSAMVSIIAIFHQFENYCKRSRFHHQECINIHVWTKKGLNVENKKLAEVYGSKYHIRLDQDHGVLNYQAILCFYKFIYLGAM